MIQAGVDAAYLSGQQSGDEQQDVFQQLRQDDAIRNRQGVRLLYVTPERITASPALTNVLRRLHRCGLLSRYIPRVSPALPFPARADPSAPT